MEERQVRQIDNWEKIGNTAIDNPLLFLLLLCKQFIMEQYYGLAELQTKFIQRNK